MVTCAIGLCREPDGSIPLLTVTFFFTIVGSAGTAVFIVIKSIPNNNRNSAQSLRERLYIFRSRVQFRVKVSWCSRKHARQVSQSRARGSIPLLTVIFFVRIFFVPGTNLENQNGSKNKSCAFIKTVNSSTIEASVAQW